MRGFQETDRFQKTSCPSISKSLYIHFIPSQNSSPIFLLSGLVMVTNEGSMDCKCFRKSPYSVRIQENTKQKKLRIWTLFHVVQCSHFIYSENTTKIFFLFKNIIELPLFLYLVIVKFVIFLKITQLFITFFCLFCL